MIKKIIKYLVSLFTGFFAAFLFIILQNKKYDQNNAAQIKKEERDELEKKSADDIAADSPNFDTIIANIKQEQESVRQRIRDRLNKNIHRTRSTRDN